MFIKFDNTGFINTTYLKYIDIDVFESDKVEGVFKMIIEYEIEGCERRKFTYLRSRMMAGLYVYREIVLDYIFQSIGSELRYIDLLKFKKGVRLEYLEKQFNREIQEQHDSNVEEAENH